MRVNINVSDRINYWFEDKSRELGVSKSAMMCMALNEYIDQKEGMANLNNMQIAFKELEGLSNRIIKGSASNE